VSEAPGGWPIQALFWLEWGSFTARQNLPHGPFALSSSPLGFDVILSPNLLFTAFRMFASHKLALVYLGRGWRSEEELLHRSFPPAKRPNEDNQLSRLRRSCGLTARIRHDNPLLNQLLRRDAR
jgi:hypothetical protein